MNNTKKLNNKETKEVNGGYIVDYTKGCGMYAVVDDDTHFIHETKSFFIKAELDKAEEFAKSRNLSTMIITADQLYSLRDNGYFVGNDGKTYTNKN